MNSDKIKKNAKCKHDMITSGHSLCVDAVVVRDVKIETDFCFKRSLN